MPGTAVYCIAGVLAARRLLQRLLIQLDVSEFRTLCFRFVLRELDPFRLGQRHQFVGSLALHRFLNHSFCDFIFCLPA